MPPVMVWCIFVGPLLVSTWVNLVIALVMSIALTWVSGPLSRWIWSRISRSMDRSEF